MEDDDFYTQGIHDVTELTPQQYWFNYFMEQVDAGTITPQEAIRMTETHVKQALAPHVGKAAIH